MKDTLIRYRKDKARETLDDARMLLRDGTPSSALNRIYYAMFYEVLAPLPAGPGIIERKPWSTTSAQQG